MSNISTTPQTTQAPLPPTPNALDFIKLLEKYTIPDINNLENIGITEENKDKQRNPQDFLFGSGRCTTALAGLCFSTIEQLGLILRSNLTTSSVTNAITNGNVDNAVSFFDFFSGVGLQAVDPDELRAVYYLFRNKITHNLFPKHGLGICQNISNPLNQLVIPINGVHSLNVNFLSNYIKDAIPLFKTIVTDTTHPEHNLTISRTNQNMALIGPAEESELHNRYQLRPNQQQYFSNWITSITF